MPWYKEGTVTVTLNSATVTGVGTSFTANARVGDGFLGPDGLWYEVVNVASANALSISPNYKGATAAGQTYAIAPIQGYNKDSADQMRAIINQWGATLTGPNLGAFSALAGAADRLPYFTGAGQLSLTTFTSLARNLLDDTSQLAMQSTLGLIPVSSLTDSSVNRVLTNGVHGLGGAAPVFPTNDYNDLTDYNGFARSNNAAAAANAPGGYAQNPLSVINCRFNSSYGWQMAGLSNGAAPSNGALRFYLRHEVNNAWSDWAEIFHSRNSVGPVAQSAGVPTGALIESGVNSNGRYVRYADGTQICYHTISGNTTRNAYGTAMYQSASETWNYPAAFSAAPIISGFSVDSGFVGLMSSVGNTSSSAPLRAISPAASVTNMNLYAMAVGRWF